MTRLVWSDYFYADATSPSGLRWRVNRCGGNNALLKVAGEAAGYVSTQGYWMVSLKVGEKKYQRALHRVLWEVVYGYDAKEVDHIDGNRGNNSLSNLREVTRAENMRNRASSNRKTYDAPNGVYKNDCTNRHGKTYEYWVAGWRTEDGTYMHKRFSVLKLGQQGAYEAACRERDSKMEELKKIGYTDRHGSKA